MLPATRALCCHHALSSWVHLKLSQPIRQSFSSPRNVVSDVEALIVHRRSFHALSAATRKGAVAQCRTNDELMEQLATVWWSELSLLCLWAGRMTAEVRCPEGYIPVDVVQRATDHYLVTFLPRVPGKAHKFAHTAFNTCIAESRRSDQ